MRRSSLSVIGSIAASSLVAALLAATPAAATAPVGSDPDRIVLNPTTTPETSQTITWRTARSVTEGRVQFRSPSGAESEVVAGARASSNVAGTDSHHHTATLTDLAPDTTYSYRVGSDAGWSDWHTFTTAHTGEKPWSFLYFGDAQNGLADKWPPVVARALAAESDVDLALHAGDMINNANRDEEWGHWFGALQPSLATTNQVLTPGNHELSGDPMMSQYKAHFDFPRNGPALHSLVNAEAVWYADYQGVRFVSLNGNSPLPLEQATWLEGVLSSNPHRWTVVTFHQPLFSGSEGRDNPGLRLAWLDILERHDVDLVLQGHDHTYARGHRTDRALEDGGHEGPVYTVSVAGSKYYTLSPEDRNNWTSNGATRVTGHNQTSTYQVIRLDGDTLTYESVIGAQGEASSATGAPGDLLDSFTITKDAEGSKVVSEGIAEPTDPDPTNPDPTNPDPTGDDTSTDDASTAPSRASARVDVRKARRLAPRRARLKIRVRSTGPVNARGVRQGDRVVVRIVGGRKLATARLNKRGVAKLTLRKLPKRTLRLRVRYRGSDTVTPARSTVRLARAR